MKLICIMPLTRATLSSSVPLLSTMTDIVIISSDDSSDKDAHVKDELPQLFTPVKHCKWHLVFLCVLIRCLSIGVESEDDETMCSVSSSDHDSLDQDDISPSILKADVSLLPVQHVGCNELGCRKR